MCLGIPGQIVEIRDAVHHLGVVDVEGVRRDVSLALLNGGDPASTCDMDQAVGPGDWVLVHVGFAMARIDEHEAAETLRALRALGDLYEAELADLSAPLDLERSGHDS